MHWSLGSPDFDGCIPRVPQSGCAQGHLPPTMGGSPPSHPTRWAHFIFHATIWRSTHNKLVESASRLTPQLLITWEINALRNPSPYRYRAKIGWNFQRYLRSAGGDVTTAGRAVQPDVNSASSAGARLVGLLRPFATTSRHASLSGHLSPRLLGNHGLHGNRRRRRRRRGREKERLVYIPRACKLCLRNVYITRLVSSEPNSTVDPVQFTSV